MDAGLDAAFESVLSQQMVSEEVRAKLRESCSVEQKQEMVSAQRKHRREDNDDYGASAIRTIRDAEIATFASGSAEAALESSHRSSEEVALLLRQLRVVVKSSGRDWIAGFCKHDGVETVAAVMGRRLSADPFLASDANVVAAGIGVFRALMNNSTGLERVNAAASALDALALCAEPVDRLRLDAGDESMSLQAEALEILCIPVYYSEAGRREVLKALDRLRLKRLEPPFRWLALLMRHGAIDAKPQLLSLANQLVIASKRLEERVGLRNALLAVGIEPLAEKAIESLGGEVPLDDGWCFVDDDLPNAWLSRSDEASLPCEPSRGIDPRAGRMVGVCLMAGGHAVFSAGTATAKPWKFELDAETLRWSKATKLEATGSEQVWEELEGSGVEHAHSHGASSSVSMSDVLAVRTATTDASLNAATSHGVELALTQHAPLQLGIANGDEHLAWCVALRTARRRTRSAAATTSPEHHFVDKGVAANLSREELDENAELMRKQLEIFKAVRDADRQLTLQQEEEAEIVEKHDEQGNTYYEDSSTGAVAWLRDELLFPDVAEAQDPSSGETYYVNTETGAVGWTREEVGKKKEFDGAAPESLTRHVLAAATQAGTLQDLVSVLHELLLCPVHDTGKTWRVAREAIEEIRKAATGVASPQEATTHNNVVSEYDEAGNEFFVNEVTGESAWTREELLTEKTTSSSVLWSSSGLKLAELRKAQLDLEAKAEARDEAVEAARAKEAEVQDLHDELELLRNKARAKDLEIEELRELASTADKKTSAGTQKQQEDGIVSGLNDQGQLYWYNSHTGATGWTREEVVDESSSKQAAALEGAIADGEATLLARLASSKEAPTSEDASSRRIAELEAKLARYESGEENITEEVDENGETCFVNHDTGAVGWSRAEVSIFGNAMGEYDEYIAELEAQLWEFGDISEEYDEETDETYYVNNDTGQWGWTIYEAAMGVGDGAIDDLESQLYESLGVYVEWDEDDNEYFVNERTGAVGSALDQVLGDDKLGSKSKIWELEEQLRLASSVSTAIDADGNEVYRNDLTGETSHVKEEVMRGGQGRIDQLRAHLATLEEQPETPAVAEHIAQTRAALRAATAQAELRPGETRLQACERRVAEAEAELEQSPSSSQDAARARLASAKLALEAARNEDELFQAHLAELNERVREHTALLEDGTLTPVDRAAVERELADAKTELAAAEAEHRLAAGCGPLQSEADVEAAARMLEMLKKHQTAANEKYPEMGTEAATSSSSETAIDALALMEQLAKTREQRDQALALAEARGAGGSMGGAGGVDKTAAAEALGAKLDAAKEEIRAKNLAYVEELEGEIASREGELAEARERDAPQEEIDRIKGEITAMRKTLAGAHADASKAEAKIDLLLAQTEQRKGDPEILDLQAKLADMKHQAVGGQGIGRRRDSTS